MFQVTAQNGRIVPHHKDHLRWFLEENEGKKFVLKLTPWDEMAPKQRMYNYFHGPILNTALRMFTDAGYVMDRAAAKYKLKEFFATDCYVTPEGEEVDHIMSLGDMDKERLKKFIDDCFFFLSEYGYTPPDPDVYKSL